MRSDLDYALSLQGTQGVVAQNLRGLEYIDIMIHILPSSRNVCSVVGNVIA
jgi:hypothetical protein